MTDTDDTPQAPGGGEEHHEERQLRTTRKRFLIGLGALLTGVLSYFTFVDVIFRRGAGNGGGTATGGGAATGGGIPGEASFPTLHVESVPHVAPESWVVTVDGLVEKPLRLDRAAWAALPRRQQTADFHCVEGWSVDRLRWAGVAPKTLLAERAVQAVAPAASRINSRRSI